MTDLKNYDLAENMISPDDLKQSEQHGADRLNTQSEIAEGRVKEISVDRTTTGPGAGGLDQFFDEFEYRTWTNEMPWELADQVSTRVMNIVGQSALEYQNSLQGSSAAILEKQMLKYTRGPVLAKIQDVRAGGIHSLQTLETLKGFTAKAQAEAIAQRSDMVTKQKEAIDNRGWWSRAGHTALAIGSLGTYALVKTEKRQKWYNSIVEKSMTREFDRINRNIETLEGQVGKQIAPMQSRIRRTIASQADPDTKAAYRTELMNALRHTGPLATMNLNTNWGIPNANEQEKIDFLEAAQGLDFVKKDLGIVGVSSAKNLQQKQMIESAQKQQNILKTIGEFEFAGIKGLSGFATLPTEGVSVPTISDLVKKLENEIASSENLEDIYSSGTLDINKADLLTDSTKLILLVKFIKGNGVVAKKLLQASTRQLLLVWINDMDKQTGDKKETHNNTDVKAQLDVLKNSTGNGRIEETSVVIKEAKNLNITVDTSVSTLKGNINTLSGNLQTDYQIFLDKKGDDDFPEEDFALIKKSWEPVMEARKFLLEQITKWEEEKKEYDKFKQDRSSGKPGKMRRYLNEISTLDGAVGDSGSIKFALNELANVTGNTGNDKAARISLNAKIAGLYASKKDFREKIVALNDQKEPEFSDMSKVQELLDKVSVEGGMDYKKRITKNKSFGNVGLNKRIQQKMRADTFGEEIDKKFVEQLEKNDQFEQLKNVSKGTKVAITYKKTAASSLRFPDQLGGSTTANFIVVESNEKGVLLEKVGGGETIAILGTAAKGGVAYKNAKIATTHSDNPLLPRDPSNPTVSGAWDSAIALNYKIS